MPNNVNGVYDSARTLLNSGYLFRGLYRLRDILQMLVNSF